MLDKTFNPAEVEARVHAAWEKADAFKCGRPERTRAATYTIVIPPPNVTGSLHMGHALNNTLQDILCRFERMRGKDVLWQPGTDHAGIATQMVVERQLMERQEPDRRTIGREKFLEKVWAWKAQSGGTILNQLKRLGASCDWSRERFTMDEGLSKAVLKVFVDLYNEGLIYKDKRLVNWDPHFETAISDLEVESRETKGSLWHFRYPLKGVVFNAEDPSTFITVATTRPETMLGDTAVAVHPEDERYKALVGKLVVLPLVGREIPIVADEYSDPEKGSGAVKITPAHDKNDFEVGRRHKLEMINILTSTAELNDNVPAKYRGMDRFAARKAVIADMEAAGLLEKIEPTTHAVPYGDRSGVVVEPWLTDQWYVNAAELAKRAMAAVRSGETTFVPERFANDYFRWMENIEPWCVSRQLWWGHQIPVWYGRKKHPAPEESGLHTIPFEVEEFCALTEADAVEKARLYYGKDVKVVSQPPSQGALRDTSKSQWDVTVPSGPAEIWRDEDVLDTWFSSALWPFSTLGWPEQTPEMARYYPTSTLVTGFDIIFFWVARMMMMGTHFLPGVPFSHVYIHGLVRDGSGAKMSKSKGNVMDPLDLIDGITLPDLVAKRTSGLKPADAKRIANETKRDYPEGIAAYGADALRFSLAAMASQGSDVKFSVSRIEGYRNFATKLWNASRFAEVNECRRAAGFDPKAVKETVNRWIVGETARAADAVTAGIVEMKFNEAAASIYAFVWDVYCDWFLELAKPVLASGSDAAKAETRATAIWALDQILALLHPFMPFITEELWEKTATWGAKRDGLLALASWPALTGLGDQAAEAEIGWVIRLVKEVRSLRTEMNVPAGAKIPVVVTGAGAETRRRAGIHEETVKRLARLESIAFADAPPKGSAQFIVDEATVALPLAGIIDMGAERARLAKEIEKAKAEIGKVEAKLSNKAFVDKAPAEVVEENRERLAHFSEQVSRLGAALKRIEAA